MVLGGPKFPPRRCLVAHSCSQNQIEYLEGRKPEKHKICKDAHEQIIDIGLVEILSTQTAYHLVTKRIGIKWPYKVIIHDYL